MNMRIKELAEQAGLKTELWNNPEPFVIYKEDVLNPGGLEKFAELVVKECLQHLTNIGHDHSRECLEEHFQLDAASKIPDPRPIPDYADHVELDAFLSMVDDGSITPQDGTGYWATADAQSNMSVWRIGRPDWATHVTWYKK